MFCFALDGKGGGAAIDDPETSGIGASWTHLDFSHRDTRRWLMDHGVDAQIVDTLVEPESRPRTLVLDDGLLAVLRGINRNAGADPDDMVSVRIWLTDDALITARQRNLIAATALREQLQSGKGPATAAAALVGLVRHLEEGVGQFIEGLSDRIEGYEETLETAEMAQLRSDIADARRGIARIRRYLAPQRTALDALARQADRWFSDEEVYSLREFGDQFQRQVEDLDLLRERVMVLQEELMNRVSQEQNARTYLLSIVAAIFLPITFISGVFGMNVAGLPGVETEGAFVIVSVVMLAISIAIVIWLRMKRWF